jgi:hypothetical protein
VKRIAQVLAVGVAVAAVVAGLFGRGGSESTGPQVSATAAGTIAEARNSAASCADSNDQLAARCWVSAMPIGSGGWPASPNSQNAPVWAPGKFPLGLAPKVAFKGELWAIGQNLAYESADGVTWTERPKTDWGERIYQQMVFFKGKLWMFGGLDYEGRTFQNDVWSSADGTTWTREGNAEWSSRGSQAMVVFKDRLWLFGGATQVDAGRSPIAFLNDAWVSDDGVRWSPVAQSAPWSARGAGEGVVVLNNALYLMGGAGQADVWRSDDGLGWAKVTDEAPWGPRSDFGRAVVDGKLWVFGGWSGNIRNALNDVWFSTDGASWQRQSEHAPWTPRIPIAVAFKDRIWIYSGARVGSAKSWSGDAWVMSPTVS